MESIEQVKLNPDRRTAYGRGGRPVSNAIPGMQVQDLSRMPAEFSRPPPRVAPATPAVVTPAVAPQSIATLPAARSPSMLRGPVAGALGRAGGIASPLVGTGQEWKALGADVSAKAGAAVKSLQATRSVPGSGVGAKVLSKVAPPLTIATGAINAYQGAQEGDYGRAALGAADAAAGGLLMTPAAPAAALYLGGRTAYEAPGMIRKSIGERGLDAIGGTINQVGLNTGLWGVDDSAKVAIDTAARGLTPPDKPAARASTAGAGLGFVNPPLVGQPQPVQPQQPNPEGTITRDGNSYSGKNIAFGADIKAPGGKTLNRGTVTSLDMSEGHRQNLLELDRNAAESAQREAGFAANQPGGGLSGIAGRTINDKPPAGIDMPAGLKSPRRVAEFMIQREALKQRAAESQMRDIGDTNRASMQASTSRRGQDLSAGLQREGYGVQREGFSNQRSIAELNNDTRRTVAETNAEARAQAAEAAAKKFMLVPGGQEPSNIGGFPVLVKRPDRVLDITTGKVVDLPDPQGAEPKWASDPKVMAIKNSNASDAEKRKQLQALGYK